MAQEPDDPSVNMDENDISIFRRVLPSARQSRGRSIAHILYDRSIHGPQKVGGVKKSVDRHNSGALAQASPSSVILPTQTGTNGEKDSDDTDSLSEILGDDSLSNENGPMRNGNGVEAPLSGMLDNNMNGQAPPAPAPTSPCHRNPFCEVNENANNNSTQVSSMRLKMNAFPTNITTEINNFAEQCSVNKFNSDYLSLDTIKPPTPPDSRHETFRRRENADDTEFAVSTISISFSPDGRTVASTHGDHTVKISCCHSGALIRSLEGHPRTPWTVKYHPTKSNIVASGCLGHQVRIWDWNHLINTNGKNQNTQEDDESDTKYNYHERKGVCLKMISLRNSIISLSFHPTGNILAIACGHTLHLWVYDNETKPKTSNRVIASDDSRSGAASTEAESNTAQNGAQTVLHQIRYANNLRCVHFPPGGDTIIIGGVNPSTNESQNNETSYSLLLLDFDLDVALMSPTEFNYFQSIDPEDRRPRPSVEVLKNYRTFLPRALLYNDGGFDISEDGKKLCGCADLWLPFGVNSAAELIEREENEKIALMERSFNNTSPKSSPPKKRERKKRKDMGVDDNHLNDNENEAQPPNYSCNSPPRHETLPLIGDCQTPPNPSRPDPTSPPSPPGRKFVSKIDGGRGHGRNTGSDSLPPLKSTRRQPTGGRYVPHVVVVSLDDKINALGESTLGKVLEATPLQSRASSVTCVKFSPSAEYCLLGYGVREQGQSLPYHPVNSLYRVKGGMTQVASMLSKNDDVNIARFHPHSGVGFVYGTKQGRVRVLAPRPWNYYYD
jgi:activator-of-BECN1-regulated-autophagy protein 1